MRSHVNIYSLVRNTPRQTNIVDRKREEEEKRRRKEKKTHITKAVHMGGCTEYRRLGLLIGKGISCGLYIYIYSGHFFSGELMFFFFFLVFFILDVSYL